MLDVLGARPDPHRILHRAFSALAGRARCRLRVRRPFAARLQGEKAEWAFGLGQAAVFGLIALILGFSFSFAAQRFEERRALVVSEADAIRTAYLRAGFLLQRAYGSIPPTPYRIHDARGWQRMPRSADIRAERRSIANGVRICRVYCGSWHRTRRVAIRAILFTLISRGR